MDKRLDDYELVKNAIKGDNDSFAHLLSRYKNLVYSVILRMVNDSDEANDLAQEVFVKVYRNLDKYQPEFKFSTWLIKITTNQVIDYRRKKKYETVSIENMTVEITHNETPESAYIEKESRNMLADALKELPDMYKIPIVLYHQQGLSYQEVSDATGEPLSKVKNRIFRGRKLLKKALEDGKRGNEYEL